jgi:uncharacterized protein YjbI with pentapeptide repeats
VIATYRFRIWEHDWPWGDLFLDVEVKWSYPLEEGCLDRDSCDLEVEVMTAEELLQCYAAGERDFSGVDLSYANLAGADLRDINLSDACLAGINLRGAILERANLRNAGLGDSDLAGIDLRGCLRNRKGVNHAKRLSIIRIIAR